MKQIRVGVGQQLQVNCHDCDLSSDESAAWDSCYYISRATAVALCSDIGWNSSAASHPASQSSDPVTAQVSIRRLASCHGQDQ